MEEGISNFHYTHTTSFLRVPPPSPYIIKWIVHPAPAQPRAISDFVPSAQVRETATPFPLLYPPPPSSLPTPPLRLAPYFRAAPDGRKASKDVRHRRPRYRKSGLNPCMTTMARGRGSGTAVAEYAYMRLVPLTSRRAPGKSYRRRSYAAYIPRGGSLEAASSSALDF